MRMVMIPGFQTLLRFFRFSKRRAGLYVADVSDEAGQRKQAEDLWIDEHAESQMFRMTAVGPDGVTPVPMHFVGRVETMEADWTRLMDALGVTDARRRASPGHEEAPCDRALTRGLVVESQRATPLRDLERKALASVYKDDFECFGYSTTLGR